MLESKCRGGGGGGGGFFGMIGATAADVGLGGRLLDLLLLLGWERGGFSGFKGMIAVSSRAVCEALKANDKYLLLALSDVVVQ